MPDILIIHVGLEVDRVVESVQFVPATRIYLLKDGDIENKKSPSLKKYTHKFFNDIIAVWQPSYRNKLDCDNEVDSTNIDDLIETLSEIIIKEIELSEGCKIYINISTSTKLFSQVACNIASLFPQNIIPFYLSTSNYLITEVIDNKNKISEFEEHGLTKGPYNIVKVPVLPYIELNQLAKEILYELIHEERVNKTYNLHQIANFLDYNYDDQKDRQKISYWVRRLGDLFFVEISKSGVKYIVKISETGILFMKLLISLNKFSKPKNAI